MYKFAIIFIFLMTIGVGAQTRVNVDIRTGDDNLEKMEFQINPEMSFRLKDGRVVKKAGINRGTTWENNSIHRVFIDLPEGVSVADLDEFILYRGTTGSRKFVWDYAKKDNWTVKAITISAVVNDGGRTRNVSVLSLNPRGNVYRFVYDPSTRPNEGQLFSTKITGPAPAPGGRVVNTNATITATFETGDDDLRGRGDNVGLELRFQGSPMAINVENLNQGMKFDNGSSRTVTRVIPNSSSMDLNSISLVNIRHEGGSSNDEWKMNSVKIVIRKEGGRGGDEARILLDHSGTNDRPVYKFTNRGRTKSFSAFGSREQAALRNATIRAEFETSDDDLRGGGDNVDIYIRFNSRPDVLVVRNLNRSQKWDNWSRNLVNVDVPNSDSIDIEDISEIELRHTGGYVPYDSVDNWNLKRFKLTITKGGQSRILVDQVSRLVHRFTGNIRSKKFDTR